MCIRDSSKTTFFDIFGFLHDCLNSNVRAALAKRGGFSEVISRDQRGDIYFEIKFRPSDKEPLITYELSIGPVSYTHLDVYKRQGIFRNRSAPLRGARYH